MSRQRRVFIRDVSVHVIQRGNNKCAIFHDDSDCETFLRLLGGAARRYGVAIHGFTIMTTHTHLIVTPRNERSLPGAMHQLGKYVEYFNEKYDRVGTLWCRRYSAKPIQDERYWLTCLRYVEQNPVRAAMVDAPEQYPWSSYRTHAYGERCDWLTPHWLYMSLGRTDAERQAAYRALCAELVSKDDLEGPGPSTRRRRGQAPQRDDSRLPLQT
jgi:putative transposase